MDVQDYLKPGLSRHMDFVIEDRHTASHIGSGTVGVLATPWMIAFMEINARTMLDEHLPEGYSSVGTRVDVHHLVPSPLGNSVRAKTKIDSVDGNKIILSVSVWDGDEEVGKGTHERYVIDVERFLKRVGGPS
jgi:predicted thioesterase